MNLLDKGYLGNPHSLVHAYTKLAADSKEALQASLRSAVYTYTYFERQELCPLGTAEKLAAVAGFSSNDIFEIRQEVFRDFPSKRWAKPES